jgi:homoserine acetyltransferase
MAISLMEILPENATKADPTGCVRAFDNLINADLINPNELYFNECAGALELSDEESEKVFNLANYLGVKEIDIDAIKANLEEYAIPFYLYSGELDGMAPPSIFTKEVTALGDLVYYKNFENSGHDGFYSEPEVWDTLIK